MKLLRLLFLSFTLGIGLYCCSESEISRGESLSKKYCSTCHLFPEPGLLDKRTWSDGVMPRMAFHMGIDYAPMIDLHPSERSVVMATIPDNPLVSEEEWRLIKLFYQTKAPDSLTKNIRTTQALTQFSAESWRQPGRDIPQLTFSSYQASDKTFTIADRKANLYTFTQNLKPIDSITLKSPASAILSEGDTTWLLTMGIMDPNDQAKGSIVSWTGLKKLPMVVIDSLRRPVYMERADLNRDGLLDFVVCEFGNYTGGLTAFQNLGNGKYKRRIISKHPGARKVIVKDFNQDGLPDIMALITQGNEQLSLFTNAGSFSFRITTLLRFPPVYGSSYFELADFNNDGKEDIIYSNGDNADYSSILKPYHGLRIYLNTGINQFQESYFYPMDGASQTVSYDFDGDGDTDIGAISFFPDLVEQPQLGFLYLENQGKMQFVAYSTPTAASARWMTMHQADVDGDQDQDIVLTALNFDKGVPNALATRWKSNVTSLLILKNNRKK